MTLRIKLTAASIRKLPPMPDGKTEDTVWDSELTGFGIRRRAGGSERFIFQYPNGKLSLGDVTPEAFTTVKDKDGTVWPGIRVLASQLKARVALGEDPAATKRESRKRAADTFGVIGKRFSPPRGTASGPAPMSRTSGTS